MKTTKITTKLLLVDILLILLFFIQCTENPVLQTEFNSVDVDVRMEVQILDSTYHLYSRPNTKIFFTTYKLLPDSSIFTLNQSDTTSCPNGWGVKLLNFTLNSKDEKIILGASCEDFDGLNYREIVVEFSELINRIDSLNNASIIKTFAIYYK